MTRQRAGGHDASRAGPLLAALVGIGCAAATNPAVVVVHDGAPYMQIDADGVARHESKEDMGWFDGRTGVLRVPGVWPDGIAPDEVVQWDGNEASFDFDGVRYRVDGDGRVRVGEQDWGRIAGTMPSDRAARAATLLLIVAYRPPQPISVEAVVSSSSIAPLDGRFLVTAWPDGALTTDEGCPTWRTCARGAEIGRLAGDVLVLSGQEIRLGSRLEVQEGSVVARLATGEPWLSGGPGATVEVAAGSRLRSLASIVGWRTTWRERDEDWSNPRAQAALLATVVLMESALAAPGPPPPPPPPPAGR